MPGLGQPARKHKGRRIGAAEVAAKIGYTPATIHHWYHAGKMPEPAPPRRLEWYEDDIRQWIAQNFDAA